MTTFNDASTSVENPNSSDSDGLSTASPFTVVIGGTAGGGAGISASTDMAFFRSNGLTTTAVTAVSAGDYFQFTITPLGGVSMTLTSITLDFGGSNAGVGSTDFTAFGFIRSTAEATDYTTDLGSFSRLVTGGTTDNQLTGQIVDLTGPDFINVTTPVTFRIYVYSSSNTSSNQIVRLDNLVLNGSTIPEPAAATMLAAGLALMIRRRNR